MSTALDETRLKRRRLGVMNEFQGGSRRIGGEQDRGKPRIELLRLGQLGSKLRFHESTTNITLAGETESPCHQQGIFIFAPDLFNVTRHFDAIHHCCSINTICSWQLLATIAHQTALNHISPAETILIFVSAYNQVLHHISLLSMESILFILVPLLLCNTKPLLFRHL